MSRTDRAILRALLRNDLGAFIQASFNTVVPTQPYLSNWHVAAMAHHLELCRHRRIRRLIITLPPRNLKSICTSVAFPAFALGHDPSLRIVCASYAQDLAVKHARDFRNLMRSPWYRQLFPRTRIDKNKDTEAEIETTARGYRLSTSVCGTLTGRGGNLIIIDDPMKPAEAMSETRRASVNEWYDTTLSSRLDNKTEDVIVIVMQRLHVDDLVGHVLQKEEWTHLNLPAIARVPQDIAIGEGKFFHRAVDSLLHPEREPMEVLEQQKAAMGSQTFSAQYQQEPVPPGGALVQWSWFQTYVSLPKRGPYDRIVQSWDTASKTSLTNDYSVCTTWLIHGDHYYLVDVLRRRLEFHELHKLMLSHWRQYGNPTVLIEDTNAGTHLIQELKREGKLRPIAINPVGDKLMRMEAQTGRIEAGYVHVPAEAPWLGDFQIEMMAFPYGRHDDQVDSVSQFLNWAAAHRLPPTPSPIIVRKTRELGDQFSYR